VSAEAKESAAAPVPSALPFDRARFRRLFFAPSVTATE
jgi:hypothetical protein